MVCLLLVVVVVVVLDDGHVHGCLGRSRAVPWLGWASATARALLCGRALATGARGATAQPEGERHGAVVVCVVEHVRLCWASGYMRAAVPAGGCNSVRNHAPRMRIMVTYHDLARRQFWDNIQLIYSTQQDVCCSGCKLLVVHRLVQFIAFVTEHSSGRHV